MIDLIDFHSMGRVNKYLEAYATMPNKEKFHFWKMTKDEFKWYIQYLKEYEDKLFLRDYRILHVGDADHNDFVLDYECDNIFEALDSHFIVKKQLKDANDFDFIHKDDNNKGTYADTHTLLPHFIVYPLGAYFHDYESIVFSFEFKKKKEKTIDTK